MGRQGWSGRKCQEFSQWEDKAGQWEDKTGMNRSVRRSSLTGKTRLEWTEVSEGVQSLGRQDWNEQKCQNEFTHWEDKVGMDGRVRRSSVK